MTGIKRTPLRERILPDYTHGEELMNMITHIAGGAAGLLILIGSILIGAKHSDPWAIVSGSVYGVLTCTLFVISSVYHGLPDGMGKRVMQVLDHCTIYFMISGTYTPVLLVGIRKLSPAAAWIVFGIEWGCAAAAATLTAIDLKKYKRMSMICYLAMGWAIVAILKQTVTVMTLPGFLWLLAGGICYTVGAVLYGLGKKYRYMHSVFHLFVNFGSMLQAVAILRYVL
ncbi:MAG: hemolysin III family protein [Oscillospiraceae bacterium]|nr:hemolysin III family protein [Oscillospiraceae bacterium]